jgi:hypothetical protein
MKWIREKTPQIVEKRRRFWRKTRKIAFWTLAISFILHSALNIYASTLLNRELSEIRQKGEPLQFAEMEPPAVPDSENAALVYIQAFDALRLSREERYFLNPRKSHRTPQEQRIIEVALAKNRRALDLARRAAAMPRCVFPLNYKSYSPFELLFPYYGEMRELARLLNAQAQIEAKAGNRSEALRDARILFGMANHLSNEPVLIGFLVAQAIEGIANATLAEVLANTSISLTQAESFEKSLPRTDWNSAFQRSLMGERAAGVTTFELVRQPNGMTIAEINSLSGGSEVEGNSIFAPSWNTAPLVMLWRPVFKLDEVHYLRLWKPQLAAAASPQTSAFSQANQSFEKAVSEIPAYAILTRILMPVYSQTSKNRDRAEVRRRQREIALRLSIYRTAEGYPAEKLEEVGGVNNNSALFDPYSQKPFVYRLDKDGKNFTLYSIGPNRTDDGGANSTIQSSNGGERVTGDDITWGISRR